MEKTKCPINIKKNLRLILENHDASAFFIIINGVAKDEAGRIIEGKLDETLYDTFYRYLLLSGILELHFQK